MRINNECTRDVLKRIEEIPFGETLTVAKLQEDLNKYTIEDIIFTVTFLNRERYIMVVGRPGYDDDDLFRDNKIKCLTERGFRNLDLIRDDNTWNLLKEKIPNFNEISIYTIMVIGNQIMNNKINEALGLPNSYSTDFFRW
jgi:hypothetical protein